MRQYDAGTRKSRKMLAAIVEKGEENPNIYNIKLVKKLLDFKDEILTNLKWAYFA